MKIFEFGAVQRCVVTIKLVRVPSPEHSRARGFRDLLLGADGGVLVELREPEGAARERGLICLAEKPGLQKKQWGYKRSIYS